MPDQNTTEHVFRFPQLRSAAAVPIEGDQRRRFRLDSSTSLAKELATSAPATRANSAAALVRNNAPDRLLDSPAVKHVRSASRRANSIFLMAV
jgi:hypothetical protein